MNMKPFIGTEEIAVRNFQKYRILLFISTMELGQDFQPSLQLNDLMTEKENP